MAEICSCETGIIGFGQPSCVPSFSRDAKLIFVEYFDNLGAVNSIKSTDVLDASFFEDKLNAGIGSSVLDASQRWNITETINTVDGERAENITQDVDTIPLNVRQGVRLYNGTFFGNIAATPYIKSLESMACQTMGYFIVDVAGNIIGMKNDITGDLDPIKVQNNTLQVLYKYPSATEVQNINLKFAVDQNEFDADLNFIAASTIGVDVLELKSVIQVNLVATAPLTTGVTLATALLYGEDVFNPILFEGGLPADFLVTNLNTTLPVTVLTAPEAPAGTYTLTWAAEPSANTLEAELDKIGFVGSVQFVTP